MASLRSLRSRKSVNYVLLNEGDPIPSLPKVSKVSLKNCVVLSETYSVERIIRRITTDEGVRYLVKWAGYHQNESTWEPEAHLSAEMVSNYMKPPVSDIRLQYSAQVLERAFQQRIGSRNTKVVTEFELDVFRYMFDTDEQVIVSSPTQITSKLRLCENWFYKIYKSGRAIRIAMPMRLVPKLCKKQVLISSPTYLVYS